MWNDAVDKISIPVEVLDVAVAFELVGNVALGKPREAVVLVGGAMLRVHLDGGEVLGGEVGGGVRGMSGDRWRGDRRLRGGGKGRSRIGLRGG